MTAKFVSGGVMAVVLMFVSANLRAEESAGNAVAGKEVTVKGIALSSWHFYQHELLRDQSPKFMTNKFDFVIYAFDGSPEIKDAVDGVLKQYFTGESLDADKAIALQEQFDAKLLCYIDTGDEKEIKKLAYDNTWIVNPATVTGVIVEKDGRKWLTNAKVKMESKDTISFKYPPDCMLQPDKPFVMPKEDPVDLKIADNLTLKCMPIPAGRFIMGSLFFQMPRYQDECPRDVTLTKTIYLSETPVTQEMLEAVIGKDKNRSRNKGPQLAAVNTPFPDIREFCKILSEKNGRKVRVPTAAEMEYVARLGTSNPCFPPKYAPQRTAVGSMKGDVPVKGSKPNVWGIYDLPCWGITAVSDWKAPNRPGKYTDPEGEPFDSPWVYFDHAIVSAQKVDRPVENMIMKGKYPAVHKGVCGAEWDRPNLHDRYSEDGLDGGNGTSWVGIFRIVVESESAAGK